MRIHRSEVTLNYLLFALDTKQKQKPMDDDIDTIRPIMICNKAPAMVISCCLSHLLWSIFTQATACRIFTNGADLVETF
ncbi:unnamed protein product [Rotaria sp. Silwood2]|nr:unnamed protein product [Rotaria sp. Silwood2]CAF4673013.1 unnamed protein product [Rotaria sp. Silwood2]